MENLYSPRVKSAGSFSFISSNGAIPRTSRSASLSADSTAVAFAGSAYDASLSNDNTQRSLRSLSARPATTPNNNGRSSSFSSGTCEHVSVDEDLIPGDSEHHDNPFFK